MKKIIIIGATSGIGRGLAEVYSQEDYLIGITGRRENLLEEVCARDKDKLFYQVCDITDTQATISSLETLTQKMGGMDILIICAGTGELNPELSYQLEEPTLLTNVIGFTNIADWGFRYFEQQKSGHLVTISSVGGTHGSGIAPAYNASKASSSVFLPRAYKCRIYLFLWHQLYNTLLMLSHIRFLGGYLTPINNTDNNSCRR